MGVDSKNVKLAPHYAILAACCAYKRDREGATKYNVLLKEVLDAVKIDREVHIDLFVALATISAPLQILPTTDLHKCIDTAIG